MLNRVPLLLVLLTAIACRQAPRTILYSPETYRQAVGERLGNLSGFRIEVPIPERQQPLVLDREYLLRAPYELDPDVVAAMTPCIFTAGDEYTRYTRLRECLLGGETSYRYVAGSTLDAVTCYQLRQGNCFSLTNLFVGAARMAKLPAYYMLVEDIIGNQSEGAMVIHTNHIIAAVPVGRDRMMVDFIPNPRDYRYTTVLTDLEAAGLFYNNLAARLLLEGRDHDASRLFQVARALYPDSYQINNNIGVMELRAGNVEAAQKCFSRAIATARFPDLILGNVLTAYERSGKVEAVEMVRNELEKARKRNPYVYLSLARRAMQQGDNRQALEWLKTARRINRRIPDIYAMQVQIYGLLREPDKQARAYRNLLKYGHEEPTATFARP